MHHHEQFQHEKVRKVEGHQCSLPVEDELVDLYIDGGTHVDFRRRFRQHLMVSPANPETKEVLRSSAQIRSEEVKHLTYHYYMVHPFSQARAVWETIMIVVYLGHFFLMPIITAMPMRRALFVYLKFTCDIISMVDVILFFFTGYYNVDTGRIVMSPKKVAKHYIFRYFILDLIASIPYNLILISTNQEKLFRIKYLYVSRLCRLPTLVAYIRKFCMRMDVWSYKLTILNFFICIIILIWWATCLNYLILDIIDEADTEFKERLDIFTPMLECCYQVVREILLISTSKIQTNEALVIIYHLVGLLLGSILNMVILCQVVQMYRKRSNARNKYDNLTQEIGEYMEYKELQPPLKNKILRYVDFKFQKNIFRESDILLSKILKEDVVLHNCKKMVERVDFLKGLPSGLILRIVSKLRSEIYLPNDVIVKAGVAGNAMYFIYMGTVAVYTSTRKEICHLEDGSHFGEISLLINEPRVATVIAVTNCEVFRLSRRDFLEEMELYPSLFNKIKNLALARLTTTQMVMSEDLSQSGRE